MELIESDVKVNVSRDVNTGSRAWEELHGVLLVFHDVHGVHDGDRHSVAIRLLQSRSAPAANWEWKAFAHGIVQSRLATSISEGVWFGFCLWVLVLVTERLTRVWLWQTSNYQPGVWNHPKPAPPPPGAAGHSTSEVMNDALKNLLGKVSNIKTFNTQTNVTEIDISIWLYLCISISWINLTFFWFFVEYSKNKLISKLRFELLNTWKDDVF